MRMLEDGQRELTESPAETGAEQKQRRQMLIALALLLATLMVVLIRDRHFWFPSSSDSEAMDQAATTADQGESSIGAQLSVSGRTPRGRAHAPAAHAEPSPETTLPVVTNRAALPPLEVEVVAGDERRTIPTRNPSIKVDMTTGSSLPIVPAHPLPSTDAAERVRLSPGAGQVIEHSVQPDYPLLAKEMKVQGSVVLQALIGKDGNIQDLHVVSGPAILSEAARQAVKQWRFRPYLQNGQAVETEARVTVNFTILAH